MTDARKITDRLIHGLAAICYMIVGFVSYSVAEESGTGIAAFCFIIIAAFIAIVARLLRSVFGSIADSISTTDNV